MLFDVRLYLKAALTGVALMLAAAVPLSAQQLVPNTAAMLDAALPDAPQAQTGQTTPVPQTSDNPDAVSANGTQQTKRILGVMPNFRSVSADIDMKPQSAKEKLIAAGHDSFDYSSFLLAGIQ